MTKPTPKRKRGKPSTEELEGLREARAEEMLSKVLALFTDANGWERAFKTLMVTEDQKPLAHMLRGKEPMPDWIREELAELLEPTRALLLGGDKEHEPKRVAHVRFKGQITYDTPFNKRAVLDLKNADRLVFTRTQATRGKTRTFEKKLATGLAVLDAKAAGKSHIDAVADVMRKLGEDKDVRDPSYVNHSVRVGRDLPDALKGIARKLDEF